METFYRKGNLFQRMTKIRIKLIINLLSRSMKNIILYITLILSITVSFGQSEKQKNKNVIQLNLPLHLIDNNSNESYFLFNLAFKVSYEKRITQFLCPIFQVGYHGPLTFDIETAEAQEQIKSSGLNLQAGNKFYLNSLSSASGFYVSPQLTFNSIKLFETGSIPNGYIKIQDYGLAGAIGYQLIKSNGFAMDFFSGISLFRRNYFDNTMIESNSIVNHNEIGIKPCLGIKFGYSW